MDIVGKMVEDSWEVVEKFYSAQLPSIHPALVKVFEDAAATMTYRHRMDYEFPCLFWSWLTKRKTTAGRWWRRSTLHSYPAFTLLLLKPLRIQPPPLRPTDTEWTMNSLAFLVMVGKKKDNGWMVVEEIYSAQLPSIHPALVKVFEDAAATMTYRHRMDYELPCFFWSWLARGRQRLEGG